MKKIYFIILTLLTLSSFAQNVIEYKGEKINQLDENGNQTGVWKLYDEEKNIIISCEMKNGEYSSNTNYYKDEKLIASYDNFDVIEIYKDRKTIKASFHKREDGATTLVDLNGKELDSSIIKFFFPNGQVMAMYYGGTNKMNEYISKQVVSSSNEKGRVLVKFAINGKGQTSDIQVTESNNEKLNERAKQIVENLPRWQPGHQRGIFVKCQYIIPIVFQ